MSLVTQSDNEREETDPHKSRSSRPDWNSMTKYFRYGDVVIQTEWPIDQLPATERTIGLGLITLTVEIDSALVAPGDPDSSPRADAPWVSGDSVGWTQSGEAAFSFDRQVQHLKVVFDPVTHALQRELLLLDWVLPFVMAARGHVVLHATGVAIAQRVAAFCGRPGLGKSTLAVALTQRGHPLAADDTLIIERSSGAVLPSYPGARLNPDSWSHLHGRTAPQLTHKVPIMSQEILSTSISHPLGAVFLLGEAAGPPCAQRAGVQELPKLIEQSYRFEPSQSTVSTSELLHLMDQGLIWRLDYERDFSELDAVLDLVEGVLSGLDSGNG